MEQINWPHMISLDKIKAFLVDQCQSHRETIQYWSSQMMIEDLQPSHRREHLDRIDAASIRLHEVKELLMLLDIRFPTEEK